MRIVICGSMKIKDKILEVDNKLKELGYETLLPIECIKDVPKKEASFAHFKRIEEDLTDAILVVNETKNGIENYIGPNSFAEIALAFYKGKKIYLYNDIYEPYKDELLAWNVISLNADLSKIG